MKRNSEIEKELGEISPVIFQIGNKNVFQVPSGYFEDIPLKVLALIKLNEEPVDLPADEEIEQLSPFIAALKNKPTLSVPSGYFNTLPQLITDQLAKAEEKTPVISIHAGKKRKWMQYAAAAVITGFAGISVLFLLNNDSRKMQPVAKNDATLAVPSQLPGIADNDLADYLSAAPGKPDWISEDADTEFENVAFLKIDDTNFGEMIKDIPDEILRNYERDISGEVSL